MRNLSLRILSVLLSLMLVFSIVACKNEANATPTPQSAPENDEPELTTRYYMPAGWSEKVTTPMWTTKDEGALTVPDAVLEGDFKTEVTNVTDGLKEALAAAVADPDYFKDVKNVIVIISDGMGITHVQASEVWSGELIMTRLPNVGASKTLTREGIFTDSAAGGTALSAGYKTTKLFANVDAEGNDLKSVSELAREQGKLVGIVTNAELADATPACYSIHNKNRSQGWTKMCEQEVVFGADLFMGNGYGDYSTYFTNSSNELYPITVENNMKLYRQASDIVNHFADDSRMWAIFSATANKFARFDTTSKNYPNLPQMTAYALSWLDAHDTEDKGFVVMI
ncbi:MAG: alkaline phosphatase, partial [Spirochaetales bacterium]|nr:alkaline phosphatase [Spirochaetales bacterium]